MKNLEKRLELHSKEFNEFIYIGEPIWWKRDPGNLCWLILCIVESGGKPPTDRALSHQADNIRIFRNAS
jgi:hypothetical protein